MSYFLFFLYIFLFILLLRYLWRGPGHGISWSVASLAFLLKVAMGCVYGYIFLQYYGGDDTWMYFRQSLEETAFLKNDPAAFLHSLVNPTGYTRYYMTTQWQEYEYVFLIKLLAVFNLFSGGHYYVDVVLFCAISFWGAVLFHRFIRDLVPGGNAWIVLVIYFFIPLVFWTSGIRKDGLIFLGTGAYFLSFHRYLQTRKARLLLWTIIALLVIALNRNVVALSLLPVSIAWVWSAHRTTRTWLPYLAVLGAGILVFFLSPLTGIVDLPGYMVKRQQDFMILEGGSYMPLGQLQPDPLSFLKILPQALDHVLLRPYPAEKGGALYLFAKAQTYVVLLSMILLALFPRKGTLRSLGRPAMLAILGFVLLNYLFIGYIIPFMGSITRYKAVFEALLLLVCILHIRWEQLLPERIHKALL